MFHFRAVSCSPAKPSREAGAQTQVSKSKCWHIFHIDVKDDLGDQVNDVEEELVDLVALSYKSSLCDCPAHVHDRETPLEIDKVRIGWRVYQLS